MLSLCKERLEENEELQLQELEKADFDTEEEAIEAGMHFEHTGRDIIYAIWDALDELDGAHEPNLREAVKQ